MLTFTAPSGRSPATGADLTVVVNTGLSRDPAVLSDGRLIASFSQGVTTPVSPGGFSYGGFVGPVDAQGNPIPGTLSPTFIPGNSKPFKLKITALTTATVVNLVTVTPLNPDSTRTVTNTINGQTQTFSGTLWELQPVEVRSTIRPPAPTTPMDRPEMEVFTRAGVSPTALREWMKGNDLALLSSRNVTTRDGADKQQPTSLKVAGGVETIAPGRRRQHFPRLVRSHARCHARANSSNSMVKRTQSKGSNEPRSARSATLASSRVVFEGWLPSNKDCAPMSRDTHDSPPAESRYGRSVIPRSTPPRGSCAK